MASQEIFYEALRFAGEAHKDQKDLDGLTYILHPARVAEQFIVKGNYELAIPAVLHDTVEDTSVTLRDIELKFGKRVAEIVDRLSRREGEVYVDFIERVAGDIDAVYVKLADIRDNLYRRGRVVTGMEKRYLKAISTLEVVRKAHHDAKLRDDMLKRGTDV